MQSEKNEGMQARIQGDTCDPIYEAISDEKLAELYPGGSWEDEDAVRFYAPPKSAPRFCSLWGGPYNYYSVIVPEYREFDLEPGEEGYVGPDDIDPRYEQWHDGYNFRFDGPEAIRVRAEDGPIETYRLSGESNYRHESQFSTCVYVGGPLDGTEELLPNFLGGVVVAGGRYDRPQMGDNRLVWIRRVHVPVWDGRGVS